MKENFLKKSKKREIVLLWGKGIILNSNFFIIFYYDYSYFLFLVKLFII